MAPSDPASKAKLKAISETSAKEARHPAASPKFSRQEALQFHAEGRPGKLTIMPTKPMATQRDLSLAYSPGVAVPVEAIAENPSLAYDYTIKGNLVAVITNGTAILGLGNLGALAAKPVMEGKAALFKRFADIDSIDLEVDTQDADEFINAVRYLGPSFGGINLEDIKAPECFIIESRLRELMDIPVFHDDQHGTAIIATAGLINAVQLTGRELSDIKVVCNGAGSAGIACVELMKAVGVRHENVILCDTSGVIYRGRQKGMNQWKSAHAVNTKARTLEEALRGADVFYGLSAAGAVTKEMVACMADKPIIFAMANPDPEITPEEVAEVRDDAIVATGRSDYPNQINNVLGFPYIFRGALDVQARTINEPMKIAAANAIAELARTDVPDAVAKVYGAAPALWPRIHHPGPLRSAPYQRRAHGRGKGGDAIQALRGGRSSTWRGIKSRLSARLDPAAGFINSIFDALRSRPRRVVFAEGEEEQVVRAASSFADLKLGHPILIGREGQVRQAFHLTGVNNVDSFEIVNAANSQHKQDYAEFLYQRLQRKGYLYRDCVRLVNYDRNVFGACMLALGHADAMVTGVTRNWTTALQDVRRVLDQKEGRRVIGVSVLISRGRVIFVADTSIHAMPTAEELADIAVEAAGVASRFGFTPRVAMLAASTFGHPASERAERVREAVSILDQRGVDFEYDGEMGANVALNRRAMAAYPFCRLTDTANVLVMPAFHAASISTKMLQELGGGTVIGPILVGLSKPVQIASLGSSDNDLVNMAALSAFDAIGQ